MKSAWRRVPGFLRRSVERVGQIGIRLGIPRRWFGRSETLAAHQRFGAAGEHAAASFLAQQGMRIIGRNFACSGGEIDLIAAEAGTIVFVEVKTRSSESHAGAADAVHPGKQRRIEIAARTWLARQRHPHAAYRFDVVTVVTDGTDSDRVTHIPDAFRPRMR